MRNPLIFFLNIIFLIIFFSSCSNQSEKVLQMQGNCPLIVESRSWKSITGKILGFELKIANESDNKLNNCTISFDHKYKHTIDGLYSMNKGLIKDSTFLPHTFYLFQFSGDESNMIYFGIEDDKYVPAEISIECNQCSANTILE